MPRKRKSETGLFEKNAGSGIWYIRYSVNGRFVRRRIGTHEKAQTELNNIKLIQAGLKQGIIPTSARASSWTVSDLADEYVRHIQDVNNPNRPTDQFSPVQRVREIKLAFGDRAASSLMPREIKGWLSSLMGRGFVAATLNRYRSTFSSIYRLAVENNRLETNPVRLFPQFKVTLPHPRWMQPDEETAIRTVLRKWVMKCPAQHKLKRLFLQCHDHELTFAIGTGLRKSNQYGVRWDTHIDMSKRMIHLPPSMTKTGKALDLPIIDSVYEALVAMQTIQGQIDAILAKKAKRDRVRMIADGRVFPMYENREWWTAARREAKVEGLRWHDLRHTFATRLVASSKNLALVKEACGHASIVTTTRYAHVNTDQLREAMSTMNKLSA